MAKVQIGWRDENVPLDVPIDPSEILKTEALKKAIAHLGIEIGKRAARSAGYDLIRRIKRIANQLPDQDEIHVQTSNQRTAPKPWDKSYGCLGLELRLIRDKYIYWDISLFSSDRRRGYRWKYTGEDYNRRAHNTPHLLREIEKVKQERRKKQELEREAEAEEYIRSLPPELQALQRTARATCIRVSKDGQQVHEILHDVGGFMSFRVGSNGFVMPESLEKMQAEHDKIYHC